MEKTRIVATIGPASSNPKTIRKMIDAGMDVARVNFSHGDHDTHTKTVEMLRKVAQDAEKGLAILGDLQGPKLRFGKLPDEGISLELGQEVFLSSDEKAKDCVHVPHPELLDALEKNARLVLGDGEVELVVLENQNEKVLCTTTIAGLMESRKGINAPGTDLGVSSITKKDRFDLGLICHLNLDYVALSFVRSADDVIELQKLMEDRQCKIPIIAKIEKAEALDDLQAIAEAADGLMVARGDLGIDMPPQEVPLLQKRIIRVGNSVSKPVITATQMLQSMIHHPRPTRAEASDVANAILDGSDAVMLSGESAVGKYPVESVKTMAEISNIIEEAFPYDDWRTKRQEYMRGHHPVTEAISASAIAIAEEIKAKAIVCATISGYTARQIARHRPRTRIIAVSTLETTRRKLSLTWGGECLIVPTFMDDEDMIDKIMVQLKASGMGAGERIVLTGGVPFGQVGQTNMIRVVIVPE